MFYRTFQVLQKILSDILHQEYLP